MGKISNKKDLKLMIVHCVALQQGVDKVNYTKEEKNLIKGYLQGVAKDCERLYKTAR